MPRGIDHLVLAVHDLEAARATYATLGFTLTPRAVHPFGTANSIIQLQGCFLELLEIDDSDKIPATEELASFAQFNRDFLSCGEGMSMLVLEGLDPEIERKEFLEAGLATRDPFSFERDARLPDGTIARVGFTLVFADYPGSSRAAFFTCKQHRPDLFWRSDYQSHANGAQTVAEVSMESSDPERTIRFVSAFAGTKQGSETDDIDTGRGVVRVERTHESKNQSPAFVSYRIATSGLSAVAYHAEKAGLDFEQTELGLEFAPDVMYGVRVIFSSR